MVTQLASHPSIVQWVVFNEGWGEYAPASVVDLVRSLDASRLVSSASGWVDDPSGSVRDASPVGQFLAAMAVAASPCQSCTASKWSVELPFLQMLLKLHA